MVGLGVVLMWYDAVMDKAFNIFTVIRDPNPVPAPGGKSATNSYDTVKWECNECGMKSMLSFPLTNSITLLWADYAKHVTEKHS